MLLVGWRGLQHDGTLSRRDLVKRAGKWVAGPARSWQSWNAFERVLYLRGFVDGSSRVLLHFRPADEKAIQTAQAAALRYDFSQIRDVMTNLYSDPANAYIGLGAMVFIARDKLDGKNAEVLLTRARQNDCEYRPTSEKTR